MASTTGIEIGSSSCMLVDVRLASDRVSVVRAVRQIGPAEWPASPGERVELLRSIRLSARLPRQAAVVAWEPIGDASAPAYGECRFLEDAGFQIRSLLSPAQALARIARPRERFASREATAWAALNVDAVAIAIVRGAEVLYTRNFSWTYTPGLTQSRAILLQRYSLVAHLAPQIRHGIDAVRASHDLSIDRVVTCGNLPDLRSLTMPLVEELDLEVETLDSTEGLRAAGHVTADNLIEAAPAIRLAAAAALVAPGAPGIGGDGSPPAQDEPSTLLRAAAALALIVAMSWGAFWWRQAVAPDPVRPVVVPQHDTSQGTGQASRPAVAVPPPPRRSDTTAPPGTGAAPPGGDAVSRQASDERNESMPVSTVLSVQAQPRTNRAADGRPAAGAGVATPSSAVAGKPAPRSAAAASAAVTGGADRVRPLPMKEELPRVDSILIDQERRLAVIEGTIAGVGERVGGRVIVQIDPEAVTLREPSGLLVRASVRSRQRN